MNIWLVLSYVIGRIPWKDFNLHCKVYEAFHNVPRVLTAPPCFFSRPHSYWKRNHNHLDSMSTIPSYHGNGNSTSEQDGGRLRNSCVLMSVFCLLCSSKFKLYYSVSNGKYYFINLLPIYRNSVKQRIKISLNSMKQCGSHWCMHESFHSLHVSFTYE